MNMSNELCMNCFNVKGAKSKCPFCGYEEGTPPEQAFHLVPGTVIANRYLIGTCIGFGGFGITYKAYDQILGVIVAIKEFYPAGLVNRSPGELQVGVLSGDRMEEYQTQLQRFLLEAENIAQFGKAKDIVNVFDIIQENGTAYIIMEYIQGVLLKDYMEDEGKLDIETSLYLIMPIIEALKKIHGCGIIHRDISPDNIFITNDGAIKVFDFGAAIFADEKKETASVAVVKEGYAPPEQYRSKSKQGAFSDIYSVGAILYQMVTGIKPPEGSSRTKKDELKSPAELGVEINPNLDRAIMQAMAVRPEFRFQYVEHLQEAIEDKRVAEYPREKLKRMRKKRRLAFTISAAALASCIVIALLIVNRVQQGNEILTTPLSECNISIWVPYEENQSEEEVQKQMELLTNDFSSNGQVFEGNDKVKFTCTAVSASEYAEKYENAKVTGDEPDIYCTDYVDETDGISMQKMYEMISLESYFGLSQYKEEHQEMKSVPLGVKTLCVYTLDEMNAKSVYDLKELITESNKKTIYIDKDILGNLIVLQDTALLRSSPIAVTDSVKENLDVLKQYTNIMLSQDKTKNTTILTMLSKKSEKDVINGVIGNSDFNKVLYTYNVDNYDKKITYSRALLTEDNSSIFSYCDTYAIGGKVSKDENKRLAAQRFLYLCLSETENGVYYSGTSRVIPINKKAWKHENKYTDTLLETLDTKKLETIYVSNMEMQQYTKKLNDILK